jgi:hypothetical protein
MDEDYAIVVGINTYPKLTPLTSAVNDANAFAEWLRDPEGGGITSDDRLQLIMSPDEQQANLPAEPLQKRIDNALKSFGVGNGHIIGRRLYLYFSGHGIGVDFDDVAMLMANATETFLDSNIGLRPYRSFFHARDLFEQIVYILDCCRDQVKHLKVNPIAPDLEHPEEIPAPEVADYVFLAAAHGEKAFAVPKGSGLLTQALIEGLNGEAADQKGEITSLTLHDFVKKQVPELAKNLKVKQAPKFQDLSDAREILLCKVEKKVQVKIHVAPGMTGTLVVRDGKFKEIQRNDIALNNPWTVELIYSRLPYIIQHLPSGGFLELFLNQIKDKNYEFQFSSSN